MHPGAILGVAILPGNELAFSVGKAGFARIWQIADGKIIREWSNGGSSATAYAISRDYKCIALGYENGVVRVYDRESGNQIGEPVKHSKAITHKVLQLVDESQILSAAAGISVMV